MHRHDEDLCENRDLGAPSFNLYFIYTTSPGKDSSDFNSEWHNYGEYIVRKRSALKAAVRSGGIKNGRKLNGQNVIKTTLAVSQYMIKKR